MDLKIKLFGERNTATRAVKRMLRETDGVTLFNTKRPDDMGNVEWANMMASINLYIQDDWRKVYVDALRDNVAHHNAPLSMACKPYHMKARRTDDFLTFIKRPWLTERRDNTGILLRSVMGLWNTKLRAYADFADQAELSDGQYAYLRFEDFVADPTLALSTALKTFGTNALPEPIDKSTKNHGKPLSELQDYYAMECWRSRLTASTVQAINDLLDWPLVDQFCYERLNARDFPDSLPANVQEAFSYEMLNLNRKPELELEKSASN